MIVSLLLLLLGCGDTATQTEASNPTPNIAPKPALATWRPDTIGQLSLSVPNTLSKTQHGIAETAALTMAVDTLTKIVNKYAGDPENPWAVGHGLLAQGKDFKLHNGETAVDYLFSQYAELFTVGETTLVRFPKHRGAIRIEPHSQLLLKAMTEAGVHPNRPVQVQGQAKTVGDLYRGAVIQTYLVAKTNHASFASPNDLPWALQALAAWAPTDFEWQAEDGTKTRLEDLTDFVAAVVAKETRFMMQARKQGVGFKKKGQGIFRYTCGGAHLMQGLNFAVARGYGSTTGKQVSKDQGPLLLWRFPIELAQIEAGIQQQKDFTFRLNVQRLKLTGHTLETLHKLSAMGQLDNDPGLKTRLDVIALQVVESVRRLESQQAFQNLEQIRIKDEQLYLDIVGDAAHALRGLKLAMGQQGVRYR